MTQIYKRQLSEYIKLFSQKKNSIYEITQLFFYYQEFFETIRNVNYVNCWFCFCLLANYRILNGIKD